MTLRLSVVGYFNQLKLMIIVPDWLMSLKHSALKCSDPRSHFKQACNQCSDFLHVQVPPTYHVTKARGLWTTPSSSRGLA